MSKIRFNAVQPLDPNKYPTPPEKGRESSRPDRNRVDSRSAAEAPEDKVLLLWIRNRGWEDDMTDDITRYN